MELANPTADELSISGLVLKDNKDKDPYTIPEGTTIPANGYLVIYQDDSGATGFGFGLGKGDSVRLFEDGEQIAATTWPDGSHTNQHGACILMSMATVIGTRWRLPLVQQTNLPASRMSLHGLAAIKYVSLTQRLLFWRTPLAWTLPMESFMRWTTAPRPSG